MHDFDYEAPQSLSDAVALMARHNGGVKPLAGGTDLIDQMRVGVQTPGLLLDVKKIRELNTLQCDTTGLTLGAAVPCYRISGDSSIVQHYTALADMSH